MDKKYKLTEETINVNDKTLYRIESLKDFSDVKQGEKGGYVEKEENLSQSGDCWAYDNAKIYDNAQLYDDAIVYEDAAVYGNAKVYDDAIVCGHAKICDDAKVYGDAVVSGRAKVFGDAEVCD